MRKARQTRWFSRLFGLVLFAWLFLCFLSLSFLIFFPFRVGKCEIQFIHLFPFFFHIWLSFAVLSTISFELNYLSTDGVAQEQRWWKWGARCLNGNPRKREFFHLACSTDRRAVEYARLFRLARAVIACGLSFFLSLSLSSYSFSFSCCCCWLGFLWAPTMGKKRFWTVCLSIYLSNPPNSSLSLSLSLSRYFMVGAA